MITHRGYTGVFEFEAEDSTFSGQVIDLADLIYFEGSSVEELQASMVRAVDQYLAVCEKRGEEPGKPFSGQIRIRIESELHRKLSAAAATSGTSLNSYIAGALEAATAHRPQP
jgi:predicted HicB family RNase H-like nuclease